MQSKKVAFLYKKVKKMYDNRNDLLYHGWHHIEFVRVKAIEFCEELSANNELVESSSIVHDLNYLIKAHSEPEIAKGLRETTLLSSGFIKEDLSKIENIIVESHMANRHAGISIEAKALSDADTLYKSLPITPVLLANKYIKQTQISIQNLADEIVNNQKGLIENNIYFYTEKAKKKYLHWAKTNLDLWTNIKNSLKDSSIRELVEKLATLEKIMGLKS